MPKPPLPIERSIVAVPVQYNFANALAEFERVVPNHGGNLNSDWIEEPPGNRFKYKYEWWRSPFRVELVGGALRVAANLEYGAIGGYDPPVAPIITGSCGVDEPRRVIAAGTSTSAALSPEWRILSTTALTRFDPLNRCLVTVLNFDVTPKVVQITQPIIASKLSQLDKSLGEIPVRPKVLEAWNALRAPVKIGDNLWLQASLDAAHFRGFGGNGTVLETVVGAGGIVALTTSQPPASTTELPAPSPPPQADGFKINLEADVGHDYASKALNTALVGKRVYRDSRFIEITRARFYGVGSGIAILEISFKGSAKGRIFFTGTPAYDALNGTLSVPNLDYDLETKNTLLKAASWLYHKDVLAFLVAQATFSTADKVESLRQQLESGLNRTLPGGFQLSGKVTTLQPLGVFVSPAVTTIRVRADGAVRLNGASLQ